MFAIVILICLIVIILLPILKAVYYIIAAFFPVKKRYKKGKIKLATSDKFQTVNNDTVQSKYETKRAKWITETAGGLLNYMTLNELLQTKDVKNIGYSDLLNCIDWQFKRLKVLIRDAYTCQDCKVVAIDLHVHHLYYIKDKLPWEMDESGLISLCAKCHKKRHDTQIIPVYALINNKFEQSSNFIACSRCNGAGYLEHFRHVENGICFICRGNCIDRTIFTAPLQKIMNDDEVNGRQQAITNIRQFLGNIVLEEFEIKIYPAWEEIDSLPFIVEKTKILKTMRKANNESLDDLPF